MEATGTRFGLSLIIAIVAHAALFAASWPASDASERTDTMLHATRDVDRPAPDIRSATRAAHSQRGGDDRSQRARAGRAAVAGRDAPQGSPERVLTRFVVVADRPATPATAATDDPAPVAAPDKNAQTERARRAAGDPRAAYLARWQAAIENRGSRSYPPELLAAGRERRLTMAVRLSADGRLDELRILRSSGNRTLDRMALQLVREAAPFAPFDTKLAARTDALVFAYDWVFEAGDAPRLKHTGDGS